MDNFSFRYSVESTKIKKESVKKSLESIAEVITSEILPTKQCEEVLQKANDEAKKIIEDAKRVAEKLLERAAEQAKADTEDANRNGFKIGYQGGLEEARKQNHVYLDDLIKLMHDIDLQKQNLLRENEGEIKKMIFSITEKISDVKLQQDDQVFLNLYKKAVEGFVGQKWIKLKVSEQDAAFATANADLLLSLAKGAGNIEVSVLKNAPRGTCIAEMDGGIVDASLKTQIQAIEKAFMSAAVAE
jgi:flagellar assembly protein FliH